MVTVTAAKMAGMKATLNGFTIKNGSSQFGTVGSTTIGGVKFYQSYGAGIFIGNSTVDVLNCKIKDNTDIRMGAIRVDAGAEALFDNCQVVDNATKSTAAYNGGCLWVDGANLLRINNCTFNNNKTSGVGICIYIFGDTGGKTNVLISNTTISNNSVNPEHATKNGGGIYVRENGNLVIVNSTVYGNHAGKGGGIAVYGSAAKASKTVIVSCTIAGNTNVTAASGPGIQQVNATELWRFTTRWLRATRRAAWRTTSCGQAATTRWPARSSATRFTTPTAEWLQVRRLIRLRCSAR